MFISYSNTKYRSKGFTLIELLVVIAIISLLSSIVFASLKSARDKARVASTKSQLHQFQLALEMYYNDNNTFPCFNEGAVSGCLLGVLAAYGNLPSKDPWGIDYQWHNPGCCVDECTMILSAGQNMAICGGGSDVGCEHVMSQTANCSGPSPNYDDIGFYFGQVKDHK